MKIPYNQRIVTRLKLYERTEHTWRHISHIVLPFSLHHLCIHLRWAYCNMKKQSDMASYKWSLLKAKSNDCKRDMLNWNSWQKSYINRCILYLYDILILQAGLMTRQTSTQLFIFSILIFVYWKQENTFKFSWLLNSKGEKKKQCDNIREEYDQITKSTPSRIRQQTNPWG
jgi:hypothetical protein